MSLITDRNLFIGSSDARDIIAGNYDILYDKKTGVIPEVDLSDIFPVQLGKFTEPFHLDWTLRRLVEESGVGWEHSTLTDSGGQHNATFEHDVGFSGAILRSHPDALVRDPHGTVFPMEAKITGRFSSADEAADFYMPQLQHHMICWGTDKLLFSVVVGTKEPERIWIGASQDYQGYYLTKCDQFWGYVKEEIPPPRQVYVDGGVKVPQKIKDSVPFDGMKRRSIASDNRAPGLIAEFVETKKAVKRHDEVKKELTGMMRDDEREIYCDGFTIKRDKRGAKRITVEESKWEKVNG